MAERYLLSILVPSFCYPEGVQRILAHLAAGDDRRVEYVISDDSCDDSVQNIFEEYRYKFTNIEYIRNSPSLGAVKNWNSLITRSCGEYVLLMHHDEFPLEETFVSDLLGLIDSNKGVDVVLLKCFLVDNSNFRYLHSFNSLKFLVLKFFLPFILTKNIIGPTSAMVFKRNLAESFDENLTWFVDTDFYYRIIKKSRKILFCEIGIGSILNRVQSITHGIRSKIKIIRNSELSYLSKKYSNQDFWIRYRFFNFYFVVLVFLWGTTRVFGRLVRASRRAMTRTKCNTGSIESRNGVD